MELGCGQPLRNSPSLSISQTKPPHPPIQHSRFIHHPPTPPPTPPCHAPLAGNCLILQRAGGDTPATPTHVSLSGPRAWVGAALLSPTEVLASREHYMQTRAWRLPVGPQTGPKMELQLGMGGLSEGDQGSFGWFFFCWTSSRWKKCPGCRPGIIKVVWRACGMLRRG